MKRWIVAAGVLAGVAIAAVAVRGVAAQRRNRTERVRFISQVFHGLRIDRERAPLEDEPELLVRAALLRLSDPNASADSADTAVRTIERLDELGISWRDAATDLGVDADLLAKLLAAPMRRLDGDEAALHAALCGDPDGGRIATGIRVPCEASAGRRQPGPPPTVVSSPAADNERGPVRCTIRATSAASGEAIATTVVHLVSTGNARSTPQVATGTGPEFRSGLEPQSGWSLLVWAPGHDVAEVPWTGADAVDVTLRPCSATATVELAADSGHDGLTTVWDLCIPRGTALLALGRETVTLRADGPTTIALPRAAVATLAARATGATVLGPHVRVLRANDRACLDVLRSRDVRLDVPPGAGAPQGSAFVALDGLRDPELTDDELAAWRRSLFPFDSPVALDFAEDGWTVPDVPAVAFHAWVRAERAGWLYFASSGRGDTAACGGASMRTVAARPLVDGAPVPDGTCLIPGRLDWSTARAMSTRAHRGRGVSHLVHSRSDFAAVRLAAADTLTAFHPEHGIAWLTFDGASAPTGSWERGEIVVRSADGRPLATSIDIQTRWDMPAGTTRSLGTHAGGRRRPDGADRVTFRGLPAGAYSVAFLSETDDAMVQRDAAEDVPVRVTQSAPRVEVTAPR